MEDVFILFDDDFPIFDDYEFNNSDAYIQALELQNMIRHEITKYGDPMYFFTHNKKELTNILEYLDNNQQIIK